MGPHDGWHYQDPHRFGPPSSEWHQWHQWHHHGPPPWMADVGPWAFLPSLVPLLLVLWVIWRWYAVLAVPALRAPARPVDAARPHWDAAVARHAETARAYAAFECDPAAVLARPALADVTEPATARFVDAFAEATALATEAYPGPEAGSRFAAAAERAANAWRAAVDAADRVRVARFAPGERALLTQVTALLDLARSSPHEAERRSAYERARRRLADLERRTGWALPRPAGELIATRARGVLRAA
ncbi:MAG TPA: hypothetical protein VF667_08050 [Pseudonocardia sp.]